MLSNKKHILVVFNKRFPTLSCIANNKLRQIQVFFLGGKKFFGQLVFYVKYANYGAQQHRLAADYLTSFLVFQAVLGNAADTAPVTIHTSLLCLSCLCPRQQAILSKASQRSTKSAYIEQVSCKTLTVDKEKLHVSSSRSSEEITKGKLRNLLEEELRGLVGEAYATKELAGKDETAVDKQFYPPGKIMHMVALPLLQGDTADEIIGIYRTPRELYGKIRLARTMIREHYMPQYKKMLELLIDELGKDDEGCASL